MPFDLDTISIVPVTADPTQLYRERREKAAALWQSVPAAQWNMSTWGSEHTCGTVGCALGWLAYKAVDEWTVGSIEHSSPGLKIRNAPKLGGETSYDAAAIYFGLTLCGAFRLFGTGFERSAATVSAQLLAAPYVIRAEG